MGCSWQARANTRCLPHAESELAAIAVVIPIAANAIYFFGVGPTKHFDLTPVAFAAAGVLLAFATIRYHLVDLAPMAHDVLFANLGDAVVAVNGHGIISAANPKAVELLSTHATTLVGTRVADLAEPWSNVLSTLVQSPNPPNQETTVVAQGAKRVYEASRSRMMDRSEQPVGTLTIIHDITAHKMLQAALASMNVELEDRVAGRTAELNAAIQRLTEEAAERARAELALRQMQDSLADHVTSLSKNLGVLYDVILVGDRGLPVPEVRSTGFDLIMAALSAEAGFMLAWEVGATPLPLVVARDLAAADISRISQLSDSWLFGDRLPRVVLDLDAAHNYPAALKIEGARTFLGAPVFRHDERIGFVGIYWRAPVALGVDEIALFAALSDQLAILTENARLRQQREAEVALEERRRLARDLHDSATQSLTSVLLMAEVAINRLQQGQLDRLATPLEQIAHNARQALREMRLLLFELRARSVPQGQLVAALEQRLDSVERRAGIDAVIIATGAEQLRAAAAEEIYWIALEALNNSLKHSSANQIAISLSVSQTGAVFQIDDDGCGFDDATRNPGGIGLQSMAERAARLSGDLTVTSAPGQGTRILLKVPSSHPQQGDLSPAAQYTPPEHFTRMETV
ncbi:MAG: PAS domain-containing protein [Anaerolineales bacterium]|nr:PAS domain-containing protein [Anaerolineales bacterium]